MPDNEQAHSVPEVSGAWSTPVLSASCPPGMPTATDVIVMHNQATTSPCPGTESTAGNALPRAGLWAMMPLAPRACADRAGIRSQSAQATGPAPARE